MTKKYRRLDEHELLLLNGPATQDTDSDKLTMLDAIPAAVDVPGEAGGLVPAQLEYTIGTQTIPVNGIYKSESTTIKFRNISAGTHKLVIHNAAIDINGAYGNGYIYY